MDRNTVRTLVFTVMTLIVAGTTGKAWAAAGKGAAAAEEHLHLGQRIANAIRR